VLKNILLINSVYFPDLGGSGVILKNFAEELAKHHFNVTIFCGGSKDSVDKINNILVIRNKTLKEFSPQCKENYFNKKIEKKFLKVIEEQKIDIVHFNSLQGLGANLIDLSLKKEIKTILTIHDFWWFCPYLFLHDEYLSSRPAFNHHKFCTKQISNEDLIKRKKYLFKILSNKKLIKITVSNTMKQALRYLKMPNINEVTVIENGIIENNYSTNTNFKKSTNQTNFAYFGGENRSKGFDLIFKATKILKENNNNFKVYIFGVNRPLIKTLINFNLLRKNKIKLRGIYKNENISKILTNIDAVLIPSRIFESFSLIARESLLNGKTIISSGMGALSEIKNPNHYFFYSNSSRDLASKMFSVIKKKNKIHDNVSNISYLTLKEHCQKYLEIYSE